MVIFTALVAVGAPSLSTGVAAVLRCWNIGVIDIRLHALQRAQDRQGGWLPRGCGGKFVVMDTWRSAAGASGCDARN